MSNKKNAIRASVTQTEMQHWQGPLPPPESLARYDDVAPGTAQTIINMAVKEQEHRHKLEDADSKRQFIVTIVSMSFALLCIFVLVGLVFYAIYKGTANSTLAAIISAIIAVGGIFGVRKLLQFRKR